MRSFVRTKPSRNGKITLLFSDVGKSCLSREIFTSLICLLILFAKIKFSRKFPNLQYVNIHILKITLPLSFYFAEPIILALLFEFRLAVSVQWLLFFMVGSQMFFIWILCTEKCPTSFPQLCLKRK